jgi:internalin A
MLRGTLIGAVLIGVISAGCLAEIISFPDAGLETVIRETIGKPSGDIHDYQLEDLEMLDASGRGITDLDGIQYCTELVELDLRDNVIIDLGPLSNLTTLTTLDLSGNQILDLTPLLMLKNLIILRLGNNRIVDLEPLAGLAVANDPQGSPLKELELSGNEISDLSGISDLVSLQKLVLNRNQLIDIVALASLTNLASLSLIDNQIRDIGALSSLTGLKILLLDNNHIADIGIVAGLADLFGLWLSGNPIADLQPLVDNPGLDFGDRVYICSDQLDASLAAQHVLALTQRGVYVYECW